MSLTRIRFGKDREMAWRFIQARKLKPRIMGHAVSILAGQRTRVAHLKIRSDGGPAAGILNHDKPPRLA